MHHRKTYEDLNNITDLTDVKEFSMRFVLGARSARCMLVLKNIYQLAKVNL